jgi:hypothetical protein
MKRNLLAGAVVVLTLVGVSAYNYFTGSDFGEKCQQASDCRGNFWGKFGSQCYAEEGRQEGTCTTKCSDSKECPAGWSCENVEYFEADVKKGADRVCVKPSPTDAPQTSPAASAPAPVAPAPVVQ